MEHILTTYNKILVSIKKNYNVCTFRDYLLQNHSSCFILRHDVERSALKALDMAKIESSLGIRATYYFRRDTLAFNPKIMSVIQSMGHEIGYHYNCLDRTNGNYHKAWEIFKSELSDFKNNGFNVQTVCSHGQPRIIKKGYKTNADLLRVQNYKELGILGEAYLDVDFSLVQYVSDTGFRWNHYPSSEHLISAINKKEYPIFYLLTHPDYWFRSGILAFLAITASKQQHVRHILRKMARF